MRCDELRRVTLKQKLLLVVDLDHTMLNSARFSEVPQDEEAYLAAAYLGPNAASSSAGTVGIIYCIAYFMVFSIPYDCCWRGLALNCYTIHLVLGACVQ